MRKLLVWCGFIVHSNVDQSRPWRPAGKGILVSCIGLYHISCVSQDAAGMLACRVGVLLRSSDRVGALHSAVVIHRW